MKPGPETSATAIPARSARATISAAMSRGACLRVRASGRAAPDWKSACCERRTTGSTGGAGETFQGGREPIGQQSFEIHDKTHSTVRRQRVHSGREKRRGDPPAEDMCQRRRSGALPASVAANAAAHVPHYIRRRGKMDGVKKLINAAGDVVGEALDGLTLTNAGIARAGRIDHRAAQ